VKQDFPIPASISAKVLPMPAISIQAMLGFTIPSQSIPVENINPGSYFSRNVPDHVAEPLLVQLSQLPTPSASVIRKLLSVIKY
jgi:hypothetical protein